MTAAPWRPRNKPKAAPPLDLDVAVVEGAPQTPSRAMWFAVWLATGDAFDNVCQVALEQQEREAEEREARIAEIEGEIKRLQEARDVLAGIRRPRRDQELEEVSMA